MGFKFSRANINRGVADPTSTVELTSICSLAEKGDDIGN
jgi:hypothetical protein